MTKWLLRRFDNIDPAVRREWSARLLIWSTIGWICNQAGWLAGVITPELTDKITNVLSWFALIWTALTAVMAADVRKKEEATE